MTQHCARELETSIIYAFHLIWQVLERPDLRPGVLARGGAFIHKHIVKVKGAGADNLVDVELLCQCACIKKYLR